MTDNKQLQKTPVNRLKEVMASPSVQEQFKNALAEHSNIFVASLIDLYAGDKNLQQCEPGLVVMEALKAATLNLPINKALGFAYVIAYKGVPQFQLGYKGMIQLAMRTSQYKYINADVVMDGEYRGFNKLTGELDLSGTATSEDVVGYFAHIETINGFKKTLYLTKEKMEAHGKKYSQAYSKTFSPWQKEFDGMAIKTMIRMLLGKYGIMSTEMAQGMVMDQAPEHELDYQENANTTLVDVETGELLDEEPPTAADLAKSEEPEEAPY